MPYFFGVARFPIYTLYVVGEDYAGCAMTGGNGHFEWVSFRLMRAAALPAPGRLEGQRQPDEITGLGYVYRPYQDSLPFGFPQCVS